MKQTSRLGKTLPGGRVIIFEGLDGAGKTTQIKIVEQALIDKGYKVHSTRNLGGSPIGEELRKVLFSPIDRPALTNFYIGVAVQEALIDSIESERSKGAVILIDRGPLSLVAYQSFNGGVDSDLAWRYADYGMKSFATDLTIFYDLDIKTASKRAAVKHAHEGVDYFEGQDEAYYIRVSALLNEGVQRYKAKIIDASQTIETVTDKTMALIDEVL
jgi:dTMP kinase